MKEYNIASIEALFALAFRSVLGPRAAYWLTIAGITLYVLLVGADVAVGLPGLRLDAPAGQDTLLRLSEPACRRA